MADKVKTEKRAFILKVGTHHEQNPAQLDEPIVHKAGDIVYSHHDLVKKFPNKFEERDVAARAPVPPAPEDVPPTKPVVDDSTAKKTDDEDEGETAPVGELGEDVTAEFPAAKKQGLLVFKDGKGKFNVADVDNPTEAQNKKPINGTTALDKFIASLAD